MSFHFYEIFFLLWMCNIAFGGTWLIPGGKAGCDGVISIEETLKICRDLEIKREEGIHFNPKQIHKILFGGICSSMAISFLHTYLTDPDQIFDSRFFQNPLSMRNLQAAYNTIEVIYEGEGIDYSKRKIQSLLNYFGLRIESASIEINLKEEDALEKLQALETSLSGIYFIRILNPCKNIRLEVEGHSLVYIKQPKKIIIYDPGHGISYPENPLTLLFSLCDYYLKQYEVYLIRFYLISYVPS